MSAPSAQHVPWLSYLGLGPAPPQKEEHAPLPEAAPSQPAAAAAAALHAARAEWTDRLWGRGFLLPGGLAEANRLSSLLPLSPATTVLQLGTDAGGLTTALAQGRGAWVAALQDDPFLLDRARHNLRSIGKRVSLSGWDPAAPAFRAAYHHHALIVEGLQRATPGLLLPAIAASLRGAGQLVMVDMVLLQQPTGANAAHLARWLEIENRALPPSAEPVIARALANAGFTLHVTEDCGPRHGTAALEAWGRVLAGLQSGARPHRLAARALLAEVEPWLLRQRLMAAGCLGLRRWHASRVR